MRVIRTSTSAQMFLGMTARIDKSLFKIVGFKMDGNGIHFCFRHKNGVELQLDAKTCLEQVTVDGMPMGEL
jgi:NOL1/NOP2/fmu family ribosome biogenesis protein